MIAWVQKKQHLLTTHYSSLSDFFQILGLGIGKQVYPRLRWIEAVRSLWGNIFNLFWVGKGMTTLWLGRELGFDVKI